MEPRPLELNDQMVDAISLYNTFNNAYGVTQKFEHDIIKEITSLPDVQVVAECGVFQGWSTALLMCCDIKKLNSYEIDFQHIAPLILTLMKVKGAVDWTLTAHNTISEPIQPADFTFLDTVHTYEHVNRELEIQAPMTKRFIAIHDANYPKEASPKKVRDAAYEYAQKSNGVWQITLDDDTDTGIVLLERKRLIRS